MPASYSAHRNIPTPASYFPRFRASPPARHDPSDTTHPEPVNKVKQVNEVTGAAEERTDSQ